MLSLEPCPFCGSTDAALDGRQSKQLPIYYVSCPGCAAEGPPDTSEAGAVAAWNHRPYRLAVRRAAEDLRRNQAGHGLAGELFGGE